jgi:putative lipoprotein
MSIRFFPAALAALALTGCSHLPWHHEHASPSAAQQNLMKSLSGIVSYDVAQPLPANTYLLVALSDVSPSGAAPHRIAEERIQPVEASPLEFHLSYEPTDLGQGIEVELSARLQQGDTLLASGEQRVNIADLSAAAAPPRLVLKSVTAAQ